MTWGTKGLALMSRPAELQSIQILRALAATLVVVGHSFHDSSYIAERTGRLTIDLPYFDWGFGVDIFFAISGFIMIYTSAHAFGCSGAGSTFLQRRFVRIAPLYWLMTTALILVFVFAPNFLNVQIENWRSVIMSFLFIPDIRGDGEVRPILAAGWTLNYEMFFYAIFACCLALPLRRGVICLIGCFVGITALGALVPLPGIALPFWTDSIILEFVIGVLIGLACLSGTRLPPSIAVPLVVIAIIASIALGPLWGWNQTLPRFLYAGVPAGLLVAVAALGPRLPLTRLTLPLVAVGDASYSLYLTHPFVLRPFRNLWMVLDGGMLPLDLYVTVCVLVGIGGAIAVYRLVERPLTNSLKPRKHGLVKLRDELIPAAETPLLQRAAQP